MKLTVVGKYGPYPKQGCGTSSYILEVGTKKFLLDCGTGTASYLGEQLLSFDAIFISHLHIDHTCDLMLLDQMLRSLDAEQHIPVYIQPVISPFYSYYTAMTSLDIVPIVISKAYSFDNICITFSPMIHALPSVAMTFRQEEKCFIYTGDTSYDPKLTDALRGADFVLMDTTFIHDLRPSPAFHMSAKEGAIAASEAEVDRILLTHIHPKTDESGLLDEAKQIFPNAMLAVEGESYWI